VTDLNNKEIETVIGYQEGWRWWRLRPTECSDIGDTADILGSIAMSDSTWKWDEENVAENFGRSRKAKSPPLTKRSDTGFYAYKPNDIELLDRYHDYKYPFFFFGRVALYGDVWEHERGYRAEKARVLEVWCPDQDMYDLLNDHPQVKGIYHVSPSSILDANGNERSDQWLTLENLKESPVLSQSNFLLKSRQLQSQPIRNLQYQPPWNLIVSPSLSRKWGMREIERVGKICPICEEWIAPDEPVAIEMSYVKDTPNAWTHLECSYRLEFDMDTPNAWTHLECVGQLGMWAEMPGGNNAFIKFIPMPSIPGLFMYNCLNYTAAEREKLSAPSPPHIGGDLAIYELAP
jgi:hypothetical protein